MVFCICLQCHILLLGQWRICGIRKVKRMNRSKAILQGKCPRCRSGEMFRYSLRNILKFHYMHEKCPCCNLRFQVEPGFFFGAMFISYGMVVAIVLILGFIFFFSFDPDLWIYTLAVSFAVLLFLPLIFRYSRILFLHWFGGIDYESIWKTKNC